MKKQTGGALFIGMMSAVILTGATCTGPVHTTGSSSSTIKNTAVVEDAAVKTVKTTSGKLTMKIPKEWTETITQNAVSIVDSDNEAVKQGSSAIDPNGVTFTASILDVSSSDYALGVQRAQGVYATDQQKADDEKAATDSAMPRPVVKSLEIATIGGSKGYAYRVYIEPKETPVNELSDYFDAVEYYIELPGKKVLTVSQKIGYGTEHDVLQTRLKTVVDSIAVSQ